MFCSMLYTTVSDFHFWLLLLVSFKNRYSIINWYKMINNSASFEVLISDIMRTYWFYTLSFLLCSAVVVLLIFQEKGKGKKSITGPRGHPIIGNLIALSSENMLTSLQKYHKQYGYIFEMFVFSRRVIVIADIECIYDILLRRPKTYRRTNLMEPIAEAIEMESSVFFANGDLWGRLRRLTTPAFNKKCIVDMSRTVWKEVKLFVEQLKLKCKENRDSGSSIHIDGRDEMMVLMANVISLIAFGNELPQTAKGNKLFMILFE